MNKPTTNIVMSGHIDHGKSTLIGRLLFDTNSINPRIRDEIEEAARESGRPFEFSFFMDSLEEEREGGITIDINQTPFRSKNSYNIIDVPGHKEFIKNMVTGASRADAVILVVSASPNEGVQEQTKRHMFIINFLGIKKAFVVVNKMDSVDYSEDRFKHVKEGVKEFLGPMGYDTNAISFIPVSAREGDNIYTKSENMPWHQGLTLVESLDTNTIPSSKPVNKPLRMPVQDVYDMDGKKVVVGKIEAGAMKSGDEVMFEPSGLRGSIEEIVAFNQEKKEAIYGDSIGINVGNLANEIERGQVCGRLDDPPKVSDRFSGKIFVLHDVDVLVNEKLSMKCGTSEVGMIIRSIERKIDSETEENITSNPDAVKPNEAALVNIVLDSPIAMERFSDIQELGRFVIIKDDGVVAAGTISDLN